MRFLAAAALALIAFPPVLWAQERSYVPERRAVIAPDTDFYGSDLRTILDVTFDSCEAACLADSACKAFTFNQRAGSCFPKSAVSDRLPYAGALSGMVIDAAPDILAASQKRGSELGFLRPEDFDAALAQARGISAQHSVAGSAPEALLAEADAARGAGDGTRAMQLVGAAVALTDAPGLWVDYAVDALAAPYSDDTERRALAERAVSAATNAYLRAGDPGLGATALGILAQALDRLDRGRDMIPALRLAQERQPRDDIAAALQDAIGKYGFRIAETQVESDLASPRICAVFSEELASDGVDYATFVRLPQPDLSVEPSGNRLCVGGLSHGQRYEITFREGLPSATGDVIASDTAITQYVRDREPSVRFPGRAYVLPRLGQTGIPVQTVNATKIDLALLRLSDRNLVRAMQGSYFGRPLDAWAAAELKANVAEQVWTGTGEVATEVNRDMTTLLPMDEALAGRGPGIYALQASVPGQDVYEHPAAIQWFVVSDIGLTTMTGVDGLHVFARGLADAAALEGVNVTLVSQSNSVIGTATTDTNGYALFGAGLIAGTAGAAPALVTAETGEDMAFLSLAEAEFDLSDRGVTGRPAAPPMDVFLSTSRGAYRAGETVEATILARDPAMAAIEGLPLTVRLVRPDGVEYSRRLLGPGVAGGYAASLPLAGSAPRGTWRIESFVEEKTVLAAQSFLVEDFLPERIDIALALPDGALRLSDRPDLSVDARYLFGAPGAGLAVEGDLTLSAATGIDAFPGYVFGRHDEPLSPYRTALDAAPLTDAQGRATLPVTFPDLGDAANRPLNLTLRARVKEGSGRPVEREITRRILPETPVIGIKPGFADGSVPEGAEARFDLIAVGPDEATTDAAVHWTLNRVETDYQWYSLYGQWNWEPTTTRTRVAEGDAALSAAGPVSISAPVEWGNYELIVETAGGAYSASSTEFYAGWYVPADAAETPDTLTVALDRDAYRPGDTAKLRIEPRAAGVALVTVLSNRLVDMKAVPVTAGENVIDIPVTDAWGAGAYVTASVVRPLAADAGRTPARALGLSYATVDPGKRRLSATVEVPSEAAPRGPLDLALKVEGGAAGQEVFATIAAVDLGILNLTAFTSPDPEGHYFGQRKLGVAIRDIYGRLIDGRNGAPGQVRSGGDAASGLRMQAPPPTEDLVAFFSGPLTVGADGYARTSFDLPDFNGTVRVMAVVWSKTAVGQAEAAVLVRDPVVVTATVPRFLAPGDESRLLLEFVHTSGPAGPMPLQVTAQALTLSGVPTSVDLAEGGKAVLSLPITAGPAETVGRINVVLTTPDGKALTKALSVPVQVNDPETARQIRFDLAAGASFTLDGNVFADLLPGTGRATLAAGPLARFDAPGLLATLDAYPYGCTEQITSKALPLLYFAEVAQALDADRPEDIVKRIDDSIAEVLLNQSSNGAFGLWAPDAGDLWLDAYVTDFLSRARAQGHAVPDTAFRNALDNLRNQVNYAPDFDADGGPYAYALMVLAREGAAAVGDLRYFADTKAEAFDTPLAAAQLGAALAAYGDQRRADSMFARAQGLIASLAEEPQIWRADYGTPLRDAAAVLALSAEAGSAAVDAAALGERLATAMTGQPLSTQEATWALLATRALIGQPDMTDLTVNGTRVTGPFVRVLDAEAATGAQVITNTGAAPVTLTLSSFGVPEQPEPAGGKGYAIDRSYYTLDGQPADIASVPQGTRLVAVIKVTPTAGGEARLIVSDPLPAGFEIDNPSLIRAGDIAALSWLDTAETRMSEFRQDRFVAAVDWTSGDPFTLGYILRAISPGTFRHPAASVEDMYRPDHRARTAEGRVTVTE